MSFEMLIKKFLSPVKTLLVEQGCSILAEATVETYQPQPGRITTKQRII